MENTIFALLHTAQMYTDTTQIGPEFICHFIRIYNINSTVNSTYLYHIISCNRLPNSSSASPRSPDHVTLLGGFEGVLRPRSPTERLRYDLDEFVNILIHRSMINILSLSRTT